MSTLADDELALLLGLTAAEYAQLPHWLRTFAREFLGS